MAYCVVKGFLEPVKFELSTYKLLQSRLFLLLQKFSSHEYLSEDVYINITNMDFWR